MNFKIANTSRTTNECVASQQGHEKMAPRLRLPLDFLPGDQDIMIGRGKKCYNHVGNLALRQAISSKMDSYLGAKCKVEKSKIISSIVAQVRTTGHFIKEDPSTGQWFDVGDVIAREKIAQAFRDALHENYRSSTRFKKKRRQERRRAEATHDFDAWKISQYVKIMYQQRLDSCSDAPPEAKSALMNFQASCETVNLVETLSSSLPARCFEDENPYEPIPIFASLDGNEDHFQPNSNFVGSMRGYKFPEYCEQSSEPATNAFKTIPFSNINAAMTA